MAVWGGLTNSCEKERSEKKGRKGKIHLNAEFQRITRRDKQVFLSEQCKKIEENNNWERLEISSSKLEISREHFMQGWAMIKDRNSKDLTEAEEIKKRW